MLKINQNDLKGFSCGYYKYGRQLYFNACEVEFLSKRLSGYTSTTLLSEYEYKYEFLSPRFFMVRLLEESGFLEQTYEEFCRINMKYAAYHN